MKWDIRIPRKGSLEDDNTAWLSNRNTIHLIWKEKHDGPINEIKNTVDLITHELVHILLKEIFDYDTMFELDNVTRFDGRQQRCYYSIGGRPKIWAY